jgi:hypothetical protein
MTLATGFCTSFASSGASSAYDLLPYEAVAKSATIHGTAAAPELLDPIDRSALSYKTLMLQSTSEVALVQTCSVSKILRFDAGRISVFE